MSADVTPVAGGGMVFASDATQPQAQRRRRLEHRHVARWATRAVVVGAAVAGALSEAEPSGSAWADRVLTGGSLALLAAAGSTAKRWTWFVASGVGLALAGGWMAAVSGALALVVALVSTRAIRPTAAVGAFVGGAAGWALLHMTDIGPHGTPTLVALGAVGPMLISGYRYASRRVRRWARTGAAATALAAIAALGGYAVAVASARGPVERGLDLMDEGMAAARQGEDARATERLASAADAFGEADQRLDSWLAAPARALPLVGHNVEAAGTLVSVADDVSHYGTDLGVGVDVESLTVQDGGLDLALVRSLSEPLHGAAAVLDQADRQLAGVDGAWLVTPLADALDDVTTTLDDVGPDLERAALAVDVVPEMFGADGPTRWLVAFVTPVEARGRTGFMGNFAELTAGGGRVDMTRFGRAGELEAGGTPGDQRALDAPTDYLERWGRFEPAATWRNVTMSPDFPSVAQVMAQLYPQSGGQEVDGVIAVDPVGLASLLRLTGPIDVPGLGRRLTADNAADFLLRDQYIALPDNPERVDALESLSRATFDRLTTGDLPGPRGVADAMTDAVAEGHIHMWSADERQQALIEDVGLDGALPATDGGRDYLGVVNNNAVGNKVDLFLSRTVDYDAAWDPHTGVVTATASVTLTNDAPSTGLPRYVIGSALRDPPPPGTNHTYLSIYTPWEATEATLDGEPVAVEAQVERGYRTYSLFLDVPPNGGTRTVTLRLAGQLSTADRYRLEVGTQPLVTPDRLDLALDVGGPRQVTVGGEATLADRTVTASVPLAEEGTSYDVAVHS